MTEKEFLDSDFELISNDVIENNFNDIQIDEVKNKNVLMEEKNNSFENEIKMTIQKMQSDHENEIKELKQNIQNLIDEKIKEKNISYNNYIGELIKTNNLNYRKVCFVQNKNEWKEIDGYYYECCENKCVNTNKPVGNCIKGNGYINIINDENIKYINCVEGKGHNKNAQIYAEHKFKKPEDYINYSLFYFEIKYDKIGGEKNSEILVIGLKNCEKDSVELNITNGFIMFEIEYRDNYIDIQNYTFNENDIFGCGLIYPPANKITEKYPFVFFTQNGKQICREIFLKDKCYCYKPYVHSKCFSVEANFGNNLKEKPFCFDITKHFDPPKQFFTFQNFNSNNENKIEEIKQNFEQVCGGIKTENNKQVCMLKEQKDEQNISLGNKVEQCFVHVANKWKEISFRGDGYKCCYNKCVNTQKPIGNCIRGNGFANLIDGENIKYINCDKECTYDGMSLIFTENQFNKPKEDCINYSLYYFEIKCKIEFAKFKNQYLVIGLNRDNDFFEFNAQKAILHYKTENKEISLKFPKFSWNDGDIFGCGLIYPPTNKLIPFIFFTQNGKQIGKTILLKNINCDYFKPYIMLKCCSIETNFGNNLKEKPFIYKISKYFDPKRFFADLNSENEILDFDGLTLDIKKELTKEVKDI